MSIDDKRPSPVVGNDAGMPARSGNSGNNRGPGVHQVVQRSGLLVFFVIVLVVMSILKPDVFLTHSTFILIITAQAALLILAMGASITLRARDIDVSFGANMIMTGVVVGLLMTQHHLPVSVSILCGLGLGAATGLVNGILVVWLKLSGLIATLGTMSVLTGVAVGLSQSQVVTGFPAGFTQFLQTGPANIPKGVIIGWLVFIGVYVLFEYTAFGRYLLFIGGNRNAGELLGLPVSLVRMSAYVLSGILYAGAGIVLMGMLDAVDPTSAGNYLIIPLAGVFLGTTGFHVGRFNAVGTLFGVYLLAVVTTGFQLLGLAGWIGEIFQGAALVLAVALSRAIGGQAADLHL